MKRVVWLAAADARGHLMRAHLMRGLLAQHGVQVDLVTTSDEGAAFLAGFGDPVTVLSRHYRMEFDGAHNMDPRRSHRRVVRYLLDPRRCLADAFAFARLARGADLAVNDFHPVLLVGDAGVPVVQLFGTHLWEAVSGTFAESGPRWLDRTHARVMRHLRARSFACVEHSLWHGPARGAVRLPPLVARPGRGRDAVRASLGLSPGERLAAVYLNPHFRDPGIAQAVESALAQVNVRAYLVGEGYANRPGWRATDPALADVVAAADLFVSGAGMGALGQARAFCTPLVALLADQPEQRRNAARESLVRPRDFAAVPLGADLSGRLARAAARLSISGSPDRPDADARVAALHQEWTRAFLNLLDKTTVRDRRRIDVGA